MIHVISSESRGQARFIEGSIEHLQDVLKNKEVVSGLGTTASYLYNLTENMYVPNIEHGEIKLPASYEESDALAVVALRPWGKAQLDPNFAKFTPRRQKRALEIVNTLQPANTSSEAWFNAYQGSILRHAAKTPFQVDVRGAEGAAASRASKASLDPDELTTVASGKVHFNPRPVLVLRRQHALTSPAVTGHELIHVSQADVRPLYVDDGDDDRKGPIERELQAYSVGAKIAEAMMKAGQKLTPSDEYGLRVEQVRKTINTRRGERYEATPRLITALEKSGLLKGMIHGE